MGLQGGDELEPLKPARRKPGRKPGQRVRTPLEIARDRRLIMRLRLRYHLWTNVDIAEKVNEAYQDEEEEYEKEIKDKDGKLTYKLVRRPHVSPEQVGKEIKALEATFLESAVNDILALRRMMVAEYRELEAYCYERYEATIGEHIKTVGSPNPSGQSPALNVRQVYI